MRVSLAVSFRGSCAEVLLRSGSTALALRLARAKAARLIRRHRGQGRHVVRFAGEEPRGRRAWSLGPDRVLRLEVAA